MNVFIGVGIITDLNYNGKALKFKLNLLQDKPCAIPCILFDPSAEIKKSVEDIQAAEEAIWLQGKISYNEYEYKGQPRKSFQILTYEKGIKAI
jgi:hypothetical protein